MAVHGMGVHEEGWEDEIRTKLEEVAGRYGAFRDDPTQLWSKIDLVAIGYDDILSQTLQEWRESAAGVLEFLGGIELIGAPDLGWLDVFADEDPDFFWTHVADVILYRFFKLQRRAIQTTVAKQIVAAVPEIGGRDFDRCTVMAHSLGTSVTHDSLHLLATAQINGLPSSFGPQSARFAGIWMLANVGRFLQTDEAKVYESVVRGGIRSSKSNCGVFRSYSHRLDPFCIPKRFAPEGWDRRFNRVEVVDHFRDWNIHGWGHYLDSPRVHIRLLNLAVGENVVKRSEAIQAVDTYDRFGGRLADVAEVQDALREAGAEISQLHENVDLATTFRVARKLSSIWEGIREKVEGLYEELRRDLEGGQD